MFVIPSDAAELSITVFLVERAKARCKTNKGKQKEVVYVDKME
jgi:hypothetical protein